MNWQLIEKYAFGRITRNMVFWLLFALYHYQSDQARQPIHYVVLLFTIFISYGIPCYINNLWLVPRFLIRRKILVYLLLFAVLHVLTVVESFYITHFVNDMFEGLNYMGSSKDVSMTSHAFPSMFMFVLLAAGKFTGDAFLNQRKIENLQQQKVESELESLKSQINPHFLFNSLNTIYGLARLNYKETAPAIMSLSDILRYVLYESDVALVPLEKELNFLQQYIDFAKLRAHKNAQIGFVLTGNITGKKIAPLLLIPFVENAMKHGLAKQIQKPWMKMEIDVNGNQLQMVCANSNTNKKVQSIELSSGIGLKNLRRRLELLYEGRYSLDIKDESNVYTATLSLILD